MELYLLKDLVKKIIEYERLKINFHLLLESQSDNEAKHQKLSTQLIEEIDYSLSSSENGEDPREKLFSIKEANEEEEQKQSSRFNIP